MKPLGDDAAVPAPAPQPAAQHPPAQQAATAAPHSCPTGTPQAELDSDLEDLFDDISLQLLARLRLGGQRTAEPALAAALPCATPPPPQPQLRPPQAAGAGVLEAGRRALQEAAAEPEMPVVWRGSGSVTMPSAAAALQQSGLNSSAARQQQLERLRPSLDAPAQAAGSGGRTEVLSTSGERRAELVLTRPPCQQAAEPPAASATPPRSASAAGRRAVLPVQPGSPYSSGGTTAAARLAVLLLQPERHDGQRSSSRQQLVGSLPAPVSLGAHGGLTHPSSSLPGAAASSVAGRLAHCPAPVTSSTTPAAGGLACGAAVGSSSSSNSSNSGSSWQAAGAAVPPSQAGDILAEWRARRQQQAQQAQQGSSLGDRYSRFLSLRQPEPAAVAVSAPPPPALGGDSRAGAGVTMSSRLHRLPVTAAAMANGSTSGSGYATSDMLGSQQASTPDDGDILARWRARRRQQAQAGGSGGAVDLTPLLTLRMPGGAARHTVLSKPPADVEQPKPPVPPEPQRAAAGGAVMPAQATSSGAGLQQYGLAAHLPHSAAAWRSSGSMGSSPSRGAVWHSVQQLSPKLSPAVGQACSALTAPQTVRRSIVEQPAAPAALVADEVGSKSSGQAAELWPLSLPLPDTAAQDAAASELALALPASGAAASAAEEREQARSLQPSRPASTASSGRATPLSSLALTRYSLLLDWGRVQFGVIFCTCFLCPCVCPCAGILSA